MKHIYCVAVGDKESDKTQLLISYRTNALPGQGIPDVYGEYNGWVMLDGFPPVNIVIFDIAPDDNYRSSLYPRTDVFLFCFSLVHPKTLENIENKWFKEVSEYCQDKPIILVGLNSDLREEFESKAEEFKAKQMEPIPREKGEEMAKRIGACTYIECSVLKARNITEIFDEAVRYALNPPKPKEINHIHNYYIIGKGTQNMYKLVEMLGKNKVIENDTKSIFKSVADDEVDKITKGEKDEKNYFYYVYNVDDRETFDKYERIHQKLKEKFNKDEDKFVLYGINCEIKNERSVSVDELITTALKNESYYFELQEFDEEKIKGQINLNNFTNETYYVTGLEKIKYMKFFNESIKNIFNDYKIRCDLFIPKKIEEMEPLKKILDRAVKDNKRIEIYFVYSPINRETFTAIEEYVSKCSKLQNYNKYYHSDNRRTLIFENKLPFYLYRSESIDDGSKAKEVTVLDEKKFCLKKRIEHCESFNFADDFFLGISEGEPQEPAKETIHVFCEDRIEEKLLDKKIVCFDNEEECKSIRIDDQKFKYKVEFHRNDECSFTEEMKHIFWFFENDDESFLNDIQESINEIRIEELDFHVIVINVQKLDRDKEQEQIEHYKKTFNTTPIDFVPFPKIESDEDFYHEYEELFTNLLKGIISSSGINSREEITCCRV